MLPYLTLGEIGYFLQAALSLVTGVLYFVVFSAIASSLLRDLLASAIVVVVSFVWFKLGRELPNSLFVYVGILGVASSVLSLGSSFLNSYPVGIGISSVFTLIAGIVYIAYFVYQVYAYFKAARIFRVELFRFAAIMTIITFFIAFALSIGLEAARVGNSTSGFISIAFALSYLSGGATSIFAGLGFRGLVSQGSRQFSITVR